MHHYGDFGRNVCVRIGGTIAEHGEERNACRLSPFDRESSQFFSCALLKDSPPISIFARFDKCP